MNRLKQLIREVHRRSLWQVLGIYVVGGWVVFEVVQTLTEGLGLPGWFPALAIVLLLIGFPVVMATAFVQEGGPGASPSNAQLIDAAGRAIEQRRTASHSVGPAHRLLTWRNAIAGGVLAFALWGVVAAGWLVLGDRPVGAAAGSASNRPSLAVLPFQNLSPDPENAYFAAGIHEEILTQLSRIAGIKLISRTSVLRYEGSTQSVSEIARELGVSRILEGSVQRAGDRVRITTQLIDASSDEHVWAERYDRQLSDIFQIQTDVATRIVEELRGVLSPQERAGLEQRPTEDLEAYAHYLRGHEHFRRLWRGEDARAAAEAYQRAVDLDPSFAGAWARLVQTRLWLSWNFGEYDERARAGSALERLEEVAPEAPELRLARGLWLYYGVQRYQDALREFDALADLWPGDADVMGYRGALYRRLGRWEEAVRTMEQVLELDPADAGYASTLSQTYTMMRRFDEAERYARLAVSLDPTVPTHWAFLFIGRLGRGDTAAAWSALDSAATVLPDRSLASARAMFYLSTGRSEAALESFLELAANGSENPEQIVRAADATGRPGEVASWADTLRARAERRLWEIPEDDPVTRSGVLSDLALAQAYLGNEEDAVRLADEAVALCPVSLDAFYGARRVLHQAQVYTVVGRDGEAIQRLGYLLSIPAEGVTVPLLRMDPRWDRLRDDPSFQALVEQDP